MYFGPDYDDIIRYARSTTDPETRLRRAAAVARQIRSAQSAAFELMRGAGVVAPELAKLEQQRERLRYDREERVITFLRESGKLRTGLSHQGARDIFWMLTGGDALPNPNTRKRWRFFLELLRSSTWRLSSLLFLNRQIGSQKWLS